MAPFLCGSPACEDVCGDGGRHELGLPFMGIREEVPADLFLGWTVHYCAPYSHASRASDLDSVPAGASIVAAAVGPAEGDCMSLTLAAAGQRDEVFKHTDRPGVSEHNGAWWYLCPGRAFGFSPEPGVRLRGGDASDSNAGERLSWHLDGNGGYRAGWATCLNGDSSWQKVVLRRGPRSGLAEGLDWLLQEAQEGDAARFGPLVELRGGQGGCLNAHACVLWCRAPHLYQRAAQGVLLLGDISPMALHDAVRFLYTQETPWDAPGAASNQASSDKALQARVRDLLSAAASPDVLAIASLARMCTAWLELHDGNSSESASHVETVKVTKPWSKVVVGTVLGHGDSCVVLEDDVAKLLKTTVEGIPSTDCIIVLGYEDGFLADDRGDIDEQMRPACVHAHRAVLAARSGFFRTALAQSAFREGRSGIVHLGLIEDLGLWRCGQSHRPAALAFDSLLRFLYSGRTEHVRAEHAIDLLTLLSGDFLQIPDASVLCAACRASLDCDLSLQATTAVLLRAHVLEDADARAQALHRLAARLSTGKEGSQAGAAVRQAVQGLPQELLVDLVEAMSAACATPSAKVPPLSGAGRVLSA
eukprot:gnl/TRDRNA2_/TRDRNA2_90642_c0_seq1.p1 gnl/TRDRNA2_/TRDRNA2_90642_c0~~gnl/TRDRNA2_/TRDRNA2_90642_c0_seq1.p1  ORF type:complete len:589 (-),score=83.49 gnl/TRDRNA2_/TRDRNA2_90642_c0_seq1:34-1800(-)